jgi:hypothetical protein
VVLAGACSTAPTATGASSPSASVSASAGAEASPSPSAAGDEVSVPQQVLPPATDGPVANLCSKPITTTADGNAEPLFCSDGAVNVMAWTFYSDISASILGLGLNPAPHQPQSAMCDDLAHNNATRAEEANGYRLAAAYYGWKFNIDPAKITC